MLQFQCASPLLATVTGVQKVATVSESTKLCVFLVAALTAGGQEKLSRAFDTFEKPAKMRNRWWGRGVVGLPYWPRGHIPGRVYGSAQPRTSFIVLAFLLDSARKIKHKSLGVSSAIPNAARRKTQSPPCGRGLL